MFKNRFFVVGAGVALLLLIIFLGTLVKFIFTPVVSLVSSLVVPLLIAAFFYYPLRPLVRFLERKKWKRSWSVMSIFAVAILLMVGASLWVWPTLRDQVESFAENAPQLARDAVYQIQHLQENPTIKRFIPSDSGQNEELLNRLSGYLDSTFTWLSNNITSMFSFLSSFVLVIATFPILLYFLLRDDYKLPPQLLKIFPASQKADGKQMLDEMDDALNSFIAGRVIVNIALCILLYIGFLIIGLPYSLLLVILSFFLNFIPFIGAFLAGVPVGIVGLIESPSMALWSIVIVIVAQLIQNNLLEPLVFGKQLDMHPLTVIVLLLVGGDVMGILGMLICIPVYMVVKIAIRHGYQMYVKSKIQHTLE
ncbi:AI-2E family transporter [Saccharibacillus sp. CPCC 101409]|uniref:AI-2E family transporter n=1 Tax=Saccharibacillus sp. CPCC 101409 TaxID=3058041 RepID=UPI002673BAC9|nr:AI-2E family transporter [Saccharibacillus sp. CPCC 101409]MDO3410444.1 AI-2E family transporter [Saccharibacillus sp. CPCC 101409]